MLTNLYNYIKYRIKFFELILSTVLSIILITPAMADSDSQLRDFYAKESQRKFWFSTGDGGSIGKAIPPFDIILLHVCSLSWDDMDFVGLKNHPFLKRFDAVFTKFNSAVTYSGPASLRVLYGTCGQMRHGSLYNKPDPECYAFPNLEKAGYYTTAVLNHDGVYGNFSKSLEERSGLSGKIDNNILATAPVHMTSFDGTPIYNDNALLSQWWQQRQKRGTVPVAMYYNSISLHNGNKVPGLDSHSSLDTYKPRLEKLFSDFDQFLTELENTGRPVVVILVPEHGAALRGDKVQASGLRDIPSPHITLVPAAIKIIGGSSPATQGGKAPLIIDKPMSYFGLYSLLNELLKKSPYDSSSPALAERVKILETTPFVSANSGMIVIPNAAKNGYLLKSGTNPWVPYLP